MNNFDFIAPAYDVIGRLVFGDHLLRSQVVHLDYIQPTDHVLILGGGTGQLLAHFPRCKQIDFLEKSENMIALAKKRKIYQEVNFIQMDFHTFQSPQVYDAIICPFFLDCFSKENLMCILTKMKQILCLGGVLIVVDFQETTSNGYILKLMHWFFRWVSKLESRSLANIHQNVLDTGFEVDREFFLHRNMIFSRLYRNLS